MPPFRLDQFEVRRQIGRGGQGFIYEAFDHDLDRSAALKVVVSHDSSPNALGRFEQEAKALARLNHPNIVTIYTSKTTDLFGDRPARYFAMEYLPGAEPITEYCQRHNLPIHKRVELVRQLCLALEAGHRQGVFHRDLKPPNLLVDKRDVPRVIDFGLAAGPSVNDGGAQRAREYGTAIGTPCYMAPEQFSGNPDLIDERSDVYGLGVVLYELLTGHLPYPVLDKHWRDVGEIVREQQPDPPQQHCADIDKDLAAILARALRKEPRERYSSMQDFADDLQRWQAGDHPIARPYGPLSQLTATGRRYAIAKPKQTMALCMVIAVLFAAGVIRSKVADELPMDSVLKRAAAKLHAIFGSEAGAFTTVRGVQVDQESVQELVDRFGIEGVVPGQIATYRPLHGFLLSKLAEARPSVVALDIVFADRDDPGNAAMIEGINALRSAGTQVVLALYNWPSRMPDPVTLDSNILADNPRGPPTGVFNRAGWQLDTAVQCPGDAAATPSFALATLAALRMPNASYMTVLDPEGGSVVLAPGMTEMGRPSVFGAEHRVDVSYIREDAGRSGMMPAGSRVAYSILDVPPVERIREATISASGLMDLTPGELSELFFQRVVVIGQSIPNTDWAPHPDGELVEGFKVQMVAVEALAQRGVIRHATPPEHLLAMGVGAVLGVLFALAGPVSRRRRTVIAVAISVLLCITSVVLLAGGYSYFGPLSVVAAFLLTYVASLYIHGVRRVRGLQSWTNRPVTGDLV